MILKIEARQVWVLSYCKFSTWEVVKTFHFISKEAAQKYIQNNTVDGDGFATLIPQFGLVYLKE